jgi:hypothetical protein
LFLTDFEIRNAWSQRDDLADPVAPKNVRQRRLRWILTLRQIRVGRIQRRELDAQKHFASRWFWIRNFPKARFLDALEAVDHPRFHTSPRGR